MDKDAGRHLHRDRAEVVSAGRSTHSRARTKKAEPHSARSSSIPPSGGLRGKMWQASTGGQGLGGVRLYRVAFTVGCSTSADCTGGRWLSRKFAMSCWKFGLFAGMVISAGNPGKSSPSAFTSIPCSSR
jgi:hypothetical protein